MRRVAPSSTWVVRIVDQESLATFKERWGARRIPLTYYSSPAPASRSEPKWQKAMARLGPRLPLPVLELLGRVFYRHMG